ncbi:MAG: TolC family protein [Candidatus Cloacimonetes bacterium]|nr:TolC family protein [Candidatus Cloacimonadota bacterium]
MKTKIIIVTILLALVRIAAGLHSVSLEESIDLARAGNKQLATAREEIGVYRQMYNEVRGNLLPQISLNAGYQYQQTRLPDSAIPPLSDLLSELDEYATYNDSTIADYLDTVVNGMIPYEVQKEYSAFGQIKLDQVVFLGGKLINGINIAGKLYHLQEKKYFLTEQEIIFETIRLYYQTKLAEKLVDIQRDALIFAEAYQQQVNEMFEQGLVSEYDQLRARLEVQKLRPQLLEAEKNYRLIRESLLNHLNLPSSELVLTSDIEIPVPLEITLEEAIAEGLANRTELELAEINLEVNRVNLRYEKGNFLPNIGISAAYNYYGSGEKKIESEGWGDSYELGIGFSMPLFTGLSNSARIQKARHTYRQAELNLRDLEEKIVLDITSSYQQWLADMEKVVTQQENVELAGKGLIIAQARYENQVSNQLEVIDAQLQVKSARLSYLDATYQAAVSFYQLRKALGREI